MKKMIPCLLTGKVALTEMGRKTGAFETVISEELDVFEADQLKNFDAVLFLSLAGIQWALGDYKVEIKDGKP